MEATTTPNTPDQLRAPITARRLKIRRIERFFNIYTIFSHILSLLLIILVMFCGRPWQKCLFVILLLTYVIIYLEIVVRTQ